MNLTLHIWRQKNAKDTGKLVTYKVHDVSIHMSFLEMLDILNQQLINKNIDPVAFDHDCREGICGMCSLMINGRAHGPWSKTTTCQLHMREYKDGDEIYIEPWRAKSFPIVKDLIIDRTAFDRIIQSGGFISVNTGNPQDANATPISKQNADMAMDAASCVGCGACVAQCKNASAMLFVAAKVSQFANLPQGQVERKSRVQNMIATMDREGFGNCTNQLECQAVCPKDINTNFIAQMNREYLCAGLV